MSIMMLYLVTITTHWLEFFSSNYRANEEQVRSKIDLKNKQKRITFSLEGGSEEGGGGGVVRTAVSILNLFSVLEVRESLKSEELTI